MTRSKKLMLNSCTSLAYQVIALICGFILPRYFLATYGSTVNGLISSITQFLGFITLCEMGIGAVVQSALYKPLAENDRISISKIVISAERFFKRIAYILVIYVLFLVIFYPYLVKDEFEFVYTVILILVMAISSFAQYYYGMTYRLILTADQLGFICYGIQSITLILNTFFSVLLMWQGFSVHIVKLISSLIFLLQPLGMSYFARRFYKLDKNIVFTEEPIKQKWNGIAQHIAAVVLGNTDTVVLTLLSTLENVSVYGVYNLVVNGIKQIVLSATNGIQAMFGNMLAKNEKNELLDAFEIFEWLLHTGVSIVFSITGVLIIPFVSVYTKGINDVNYVVPVFAGLLVIAQAAYCLRLPYNVMVLAAGHYKQTQWSAIIESILNILISIILVFHYGLIGVAIGTLISMIYRTIYLAWYLSKNVIKRKLVYYISHTLVDILYAVLFIGWIFKNADFYSMTNISYFSWLVLAVKVGITGIIFALLINIVFYRSFTINTLKRFYCKLLKKR